MRRISQFRQAAGQLSGIISTTTQSASSTAASRRTVSSAYSCTLYRHENAGYQICQPTPARRFSTTSTSLEKKSLPESLLTEQEADWGTDLAPSLDDTHYRPPPVASQAESSEDVSDPSYVPATIAGDLERVGGLDGWWDKSENYKTSFTSFKPRRKISEPAALRLILRRAINEAYALRQAGLDSMLTSSWPVGGLRQLSRALAITYDSDGRPTGNLQAVVADLQRPQTYGTAAPSAKLLLPKADKVEDSSWESASLSDDVMKFAVYKRFFQLSGRRIPDSGFGGVTNGSSILALVQQQPKAQSLAQEIKVGRPEVLDIPNITFTAKRITRGDKDKAVGRFKVIEEELRKRDLPLKGHGFAERNKELLYHSGGV